MRIHKTSLMAACTLAALIGVSARAADRILTITINDYAPTASVGPLDGVQQDRINSLKIAQRLGFDTSGAVQLQNNQATLSGIRNALATLEQMTAGNDRVFIYYSGHGGTKQVSSVCQSTLVTWEDEDLLSSEFYEYLERIRNKAPLQLFVMLDSCHSGEFTNRRTRGSGATETATVRPKMRIKAKDGQPMCNAPVNFVVSKMDFVDKTRGSAKGTMNEALGGQMVMLSAAKENEVAWDSDSGGAATSAVLKCLNDPATQSIQGNGFVSAVTLSQCTQAIIDREQPEATRQHVVAHGQATAPLAMEGHSGAAPVGSANKAIITAQPTRSEQVIATLQQIAKEGANDKWGFSVQSSRAVVPLKDPDKNRLVSFRYNSSQPGFGYLLYVGTDGYSMQQLFPEPGENNFLPASGEFPALRIDGPPGANTFLFVMSQMPRNFDAVFTKGDSAGTTSNAAIHALQCELGLRNAARVNPGIPCEKTRNAARVKPPQNMGTVEGYVAQMIVVVGK